MTRPYDPTMEREPERASTSSAGHRLLYIDDDPSLGHYVQRQFCRLGHAVEIVDSGDAGLARIVDGDFSAVALDHSIMGGDGLAILGAIRALTDPPPVIVTGKCDSRIAVSALKAGATDYVVKDAEGKFVEALEAAVRSAVAGVVMRREKDQADRAIVEARDRFETLAAERQVLVREVNHRVGNSLQLVAAFLHLQANASSAETRAALQEANRRVMAIAQVHRRLDTSDDVTTVALDNYLAALIDELRDPGEAAVSRLSLEAVSVSIDTDSAASIGVIVTELVINALKHAYPSGAGPVRVRLEADGEAHYRLVVEDDGVGKTAPTQPASGSASSGIGRTIITAMTSKLHGTMTYDETKTGTRAILRFGVEPRALAGL